MSLPSLCHSSLAEACTNNAGPAFTNAWRAIKQRPWWNMAVGEVVEWKNPGTHMKSQLLGKWKASCSFSWFLFDHYLRSLKGQPPLFPGDEVTAETLVIPKWESDIICSLLPHSSLKEERILEVCFPENLLSWGLKPRAVCSQIFCSRDMPKHRPGAHKYSEEGPYPPFSTYPGSMTLPQLIRQAWCAIYWQTLSLGMMRWWPCYKVRENGGNVQRLA